MPKADANGIQIEYERFGDPSGRPLLLIMGLGAQMILWDDEFCQRLAERGHAVIRFDNRDVGLSTHLHEAGPANVTAALAAAQAGEPIEAPYTLDDMADDAVGLLDALGIESAHVCGASMGGMIAQTVAIRHPERVRSLISIMSTTGNPQLPPARPEAMAILLKPPPAEREAHVEHMVETARVIGSPGFPFEEERIRARAALAFDRCFDPDGVTRQLVAILAHGSRRPALEKLRVPTLVIHGAEDPLVPLAAGQDTAEAIPGAKLRVFEGMGHDLPRPLWPEIVDAIAQHTAEAENAG